MYEFIPCFELLLTLSFDFRYNFTFQLNNFFRDTELFISYIGINTRENLF